MTSEVFYMELKNRKKFIDFLSDYIRRKDRHTDNFFHIILFTLIFFISYILVYVSACVCVCRCIYIGVYPFNSQKKKIPKLPILVPFHLAVSLYYAYRCRRFLLSLDDL